MNDNRVKAAREERASRINKNKSMMAYEKGSDHDDQIRELTARLEYINEQVENKANKIKKEIAHKKNPFKFNRIW